MPFGVVDFVLRVSRQFQVDFFLTTVISRDTDVLSESVSMAKFRPRTVGEPFQIITPSHVETCMCVFICLCKSVRRSYRVRNERVCSTLLLLEKLTAVGDINH